MCSATRDVRFGPITDIDDIRSPHPQRCISVLPLRPPKFDRDIAAHTAALTEAVLECGRDLRGLLLLRNPIQRRPILKAIAEVVFS